MVQRKYNICFCPITYYSDHVIYIYKHEIMHQALHLLVVITAVLMQKCILGYMPYLGLCVIRQRLRNPPPLENNKRHASTSTRNTYISCKLFVASIKIFLGFFWVKIPYRCFVKLTAVKTETIQKGQ